MNPVLSTPRSALPAPASAPRALLVAIHGIMTSQTDPSWPDRLDAYAFQHHPEVKVLKKEYMAGPFPRFNALKNRRLAAGLANEIELFVSSQPAQESDLPVQESPKELEAVQGRETPIPERFEFLGNPPTRFSPPIWFVAHSNGALIALLVTNRLIEHGHWIGGVILTGAACEADIRKNRILGWLQSGRLGFAAAYCSGTDHVLPPGPGTFKAWLWRRLVWPYGSLGRTGWVRINSEGRTSCYQHEIGEARRAGDSPPCLFGRRLVTRWFEGGHSTYFSAENRDRTFGRIFEDMARAHGAPIFNRLKTPVNQKRIAHAEPHEPSHRISVDERLLR